MDDVVLQQGRLGQFEQPDWQPLETLLPDLLCRRFMWMNSVLLEDGRELQAYKHSDTRRYLWLDPAARTFESLGDHGFRIMRRREAVEQVFGVWWVLEVAEAPERRALAQVFRDLADGGDRHLLPACPALPLRFVPPA